MMKKQAPMFFALLLLTAAAFAAMALYVGGTPLLGMRDTIPQDISVTDYTLFPLTSKDGVCYDLHLDNPHRLSGLSLVIVAARPFSLTLGGQNRYAYNRQDHYQRVLEIPLDDGESAYDVCITMQNAEKPLKALLTTHARHQRALAQSTAINCVCIGMLLAMFLYFLTLYLHKRSERYLLYQGIVDLVFLIMAVLCSGSFPLPMNHNAYLRLMSLTHLAQPVAIHAALFYLADPPAGTLSARVARGMPLLVAAIAVSRLLVDRYQLVGQYYLLLAILFTLSLILFSQTLPRRQSGMTLLCVSYVLWFAVAIFSIWINRALLPKTTVFAYLYVSQLAVAVFLAACMVCVNARFAGKFSQADALVIELDAKVERRTAQLVAQQEMRQQMMVNIFHDLRSPLFAARGCAEMMRAGDEESAEYLHVMRSKLDFLTELTEQLFLAAKLEDGQITFACEMIDLLSLCQDLADEARVEAEAQQKRFVLHADAPQFVLGDGFRLRQALTNLLTNAFKFTPKDGQITLSLGAQDGFVALSVQDTGSGIPEADLPHVFKRYYHGQNTDKQRSTGLGLTIASEIAKAHGGRIEVESTLGEGTTFRLLLPLCEDDPDGMLLALV